jgi:outer membrane protein OmpA-like peptidoglycan-associated protein
MISLLVTALIICGALLDNTLAVCAQPSKVISTPNNTRIITRLSTSEARLLSSDTTVWNIPQPRIGLFGAGVMNWHQAQFSTLPLPNFRSPFSDVNQTGNDSFFTGGLQPSFALGMLVEAPLSTWLGLAFRVSYAAHPYSFVARQTFPTVDTNGNDGSVTFTNTVDAGLSSLGVEAMVQVNPFDGLNLYAGARGGYFITRTFAQTSTINRPDLAFQQNRTTWNDNNGTLSNALNIAALGGIGYDIRIPLSNEQGAAALIIAPEAFAFVGLTPVVSDIGGTPAGFWHLHHARAGIALKYQPPQPREIREEREQIDTIQIVPSIAELRAGQVKGVAWGKVLEGAAQHLRDTIEQPILRRITNTHSRVDTVYIPPSSLAGMVQAFGVDERGEEKPVARITIEEFLANRYLPLLNYVFFAENSAELPERYTALSEREVAEFTVPKLYNYEPMRAYQQILNIVARRMRLYPNAKITLTGCNANLGSEKGALALSLRRAQAARAYLINTWHIDSARITVKARNLSENPSIPITEADKIEENRRVEVTSDTPEILEWIVTPDTLRAITPPLVRFRLNAQARQGIKAWRLTIQRGGEFVRSFSGKGTLPEKIDWDVLKEERSRSELFIRNDHPFEYTLTLTDNNGTTLATETNALPVELVTIQKKRRELRNDKEFEQLSLILFDFNRSQLSDIHKRTAEFVRSRIKSSSDVEILGYTDRTGSVEYNRKLSEQRARQIADLVRHPRTTVRGIGKDQLLYDNELPEGRYYCRTVTVTIETPIQQP